MLIKGILTLKIEPTLKLHTVIKAKYLQCFETHSKLRLHYSPRWGVVNTGGEKEMGVGMFEMVAMGNKVPIKLKHDDIIDTVNAFIWTQKDLCTMKLH